MTGERDKFNAFKRMTFLSGDRLELVEDRFRAQSLRITGGLAPLIFCTRGILSPSLGHFAKRRRRCPRRGHLGANQPQIGAGISRRARA
jgi:hypothetical protein